jgi:hypothetical protein
VNVSDHIGPISEFSMKIALEKYLRRPLLKRMHAYTLTDTAALQLLIDLHVCVGVATWLRDLSVIGIRVTGI